jgi:hypothetical protein
MTQFLKPIHCSVWSLKTWRCLRQLECRVSIHISKTGFETTFLRLHEIDIIAAKHARNTAKDKIEETEIRRGLIRKIYRRDHLQDPRTEGSTVLKTDIGLWIGFLWFMLKANGTSSHHGNELLS